MTVDFKYKDNYNAEDLISIVSLLRAPNGCPWDKEQTHYSIKKNFIEETYEVIEAINKNDNDALKEELGDVLLQIALHSQMEKETGNFDFDDVADGICKKLILRHPHIFGDVNVSGTEDVLNNWDAIKLKEKGMKNAAQSMAAVPKELPALMRAQKVQKKAAKEGFDWDNIGGAEEKLFEEINELNNALKNKDKQNIEEEFGDLLFSAVNIARFIDVDSEEALTAATNKFCNRFAVVSDLADQNGIDMKTSDIDALDNLWVKAKQILSEKSETEEI